ncbi:Short-chain fatty acids transporter, partial [Fusobacterium necrophorum subsp. funduliforme B35]
MLVTGHTMASSPVFKNLLEKMASKLKTPRQAIVVVTLVSTIA